VSRTAGTALAAAVVAAEGKGAAAADAADEGGGTVVARGSKEVGAGRTGSGGAEGGGGSGGGGAGGGRGGGGGGGGVGDGRGGGGGVAAEGAPQGALGCWLVELEQHSRAATRGGVPAAPPGAPERVCEARHLKDCGAWVAAGVLYAVSAGAAAEAAEACQLRPEKKATACLPQQVTTVASCPQMILGRAPEPQRHHGKPIVPTSTPRQSRKWKPMA